MVRSVLLSIAVMLLPGLAASQPSPPQGSILAGAVDLRPTGDPAFDAWRADFAGRTIASGRSPEVVRGVLADLTPDPRVVALDRNQPEFVRPVWDYVDRAVTADRIALGRRLRAQHADLFARIETAYGVDGDIIAGIWAVETNFGRAPLPFAAPQAIATLAAEGRRRERFEAYLTALIDMVARGYAGPAELRSSWAGALGQPQFMPDVYLSDAVDWNGDGRRDIWRDEGDVFASVANYLVRRGWKRGEPVYDEVRLPAGFDYGAADGRRLPVEAWSAQGVARMGAPFPAPSLPLMAELFLPAGADGPALLLYDNFRAVRAYNPSDRYSLAVALLANGFEGGAGLRAPWPRAQGALPKADMQRLQALLIQRGYELGEADGVFGGRTRAAIRAYQRDAGLPADGWASPALLAQLEQAEALPLDEAGVTRLQQTFARLGEPIGAPTGTVGPKTKAAIERLERRIGVAQTGAATDFILARAEAELIRARAAEAAPRRRRSP